ncbi:hypothetical protein HPB51_025062 [Rhipicephalus microplus]|uniref:Triglyceride lipase-cholesterol esterase n=1 Tax=Rhipicephalus microplus TaxID=6941 RepID=A0A9J6DKG4_RHIMP|nr:hypothetical protein HPB51_025062 [Rhipicephalus microplus]
MEKAMAAAKTPRSDGSPPPARSCPQIYERGEQLIASKGYPVVQYAVMTKDHYNITMQRIPGGRKGTRQWPKGGKPVAFLMTGLECSSADFVVNLPHQSLGKRFYRACFILADHGFDVWLGNVRGTQYSSHKWLSKENEAFWDFGGVRHDQLLFWSRSETLSQLCSRQSAVRCSRWQAQALTTVLGWPWRLSSRPSPASVGTPQAPGIAPPDYQRAQGEEQRSRPKSRIGVRHDQLLFWSRSETLSQLCSRQSAVRCSRWQAQALTTVLGWPWRLSSRPSPASVGTPQAPGIAPPDYQRAQGEEQRSRPKSRIIDEMAAYDLPAQLDWVLKTTQQSSLQYVGWSQGCAILFALLAERPEYNKKVQLFHAIAPAVFLGHMTSPMKRLEPISKQIYLLPPRYNLKKVTVPVAIYWGDGDVFVTPRDVALLAKRLPNVVLNYKAQLIASQGYPVEEYDIMTEDWYIITVQRIPAGRGATAGGIRKRKPVVFLMSGLEGCSADYVVNLPHQSLGFILADNSFDVWIGNVRGTKYSRHLFLERKQRKFWNFCLDEMIRYDLPAQIDSILYHTGEAALQFVGWSQGGGIMFGFLADRPEYNKKKIVDLLFGGTLTGRNEQLLNKVKLLSCRSVRPRGLCNASFILMNGGYPIDMNTTRLPVYLANDPAGTSVRNVLHLAQKRPPSYDMRKVTAPVAIYWGFILADKGYDVWLANVRGSRYSSHLRLHKDSSAFWNFSLDEMISYDLPDQIDAVLKMTQQESLLYVGYSQGTAIMFGLLASKPEYNKKIRLFNAFAPVAFMGHMTAALRHLVPVASLLVRMLTSISTSLSSQGSVLSGLRELTCIKILPVCKVGFYAINGGFPVEWNKTRLPVFLANYPSGTSVRNIAHFSQLVKSNRFQKYDWGPTKNVATYGTPRPPAYNLANVKAPVVLYWSDGDVLSTPKDVEDLAKILPNVVLNFKVPVKGFTHLDFEWSIKAKDHLYRKVLEIMSKYSKK